MCNYEDMAALFARKNITVLSLEEITENTVLAIWKPDARLVTCSPGTSLLIGLWTTSEARIFLQNGIEAVGADRLIYAGKQANLPLSQTFSLHFSSITDTDSLIFKSRGSQPLPRSMIFGNFLASDSRFLFFIKTRLY